MPERDLTPREVADALGVTVRTVQRWVSSGRLDATRVGGRVRVSRSSLATVQSSPATHTRAVHRTPIRAVLIANRGEVVARVARTARVLGIRTVGVHVGDDRPRGLDESVAVPSYLDSEAIVDAARRAGADAIHPGYGFLAESPEFARDVEAAGLRWVGPPPAAIAAMGDKAAARRHAGALSVPTVRGYDGEAQDDTRLAAEADRIGYPVLVKPSAGGGGKGMRVVRQPADLAGALAASRREAHRSFGDDRLVLERFLVGARHVEIQVMFDAYGAGVDLGERDCSTQRRNQKIVEEAPAPSLVTDRRERMAAAALVVAGSVGYAGAGTVEMLATDDGSFYFLEMNTRLQVEHPVTEAVTGRDLVADQLRVASGATLAELGLAGRPPLHGHAIEARLYAEDPESGFLPATGRLLNLRWPHGVRVDTGVEEGDEVSDRYDPMLAKLVAHGATRDEAIARLREGLGATTVLGVRTNLRFLRWLLDEGTLGAGEMRTDTLESLPLPGPAVADAWHWEAAGRALVDAAPRDPWSGGWRLNAPPSVRVRHANESRAVVLTTDRTGDGVQVAFDGAAAYADVDGQSLEFELEPPPSAERAGATGVSGDAGPGATALVAPMPGRVAAVRAIAGSEVAEREPVVVLEAMKMEHAVVAPVAGRVARVLVSEGQQVQRGELLAEVEPT